MSLNEERLGMTEKVENFFQVNNKTCITPNSALKKNKPCLFRYRINKYFEIIYRMYCLYL